MHRTNESSFPTTQWPDHQCQSTSVSGHVFDVHDQTPCMAGAHRIKVPAQCLCALLNIVEFNTTLSTNAFLFHFASVLKATKGGNIFSNLFLTTLTTTKNKQRHSSFMFGTKNMKDSTKEQKNKLEKGIEWVCPNKLTKNRGMFGS